MIRLGRQNLKIRAGDRRFKTVDTFVTPVSMTVTAIQPHSHQRARDVSLSARLPDGSRRTLLHIADWDFRWQDHYRLATPLRLPAGTTLESVFHFDNSDDNPRNPIVPARDVAWGWRTADEMADVWVQVFTDTVADGRNAYPAGAPESDRRRRRRCRDIDRSRTRSFQPAQRCGIDLSGDATTTTGARALHRGAETETGAPVLSIQRRRGARRARPPGGGRRHLPRGHRC